MAVCVESKQETTTHVLLIEDVPGDARLICYSLRCIEGKAYDIVQAASLNQAVEASEHQRFDVVLLDLSLPDSSGLETVTRARDFFGHLPIIVMTGLDDDVLALRAVQAGAQDYIRKGETDGRSLSRCIRYAVERQRHQKLLAERNSLLARTNDDLCRLTFALTHDLQTPLASLTGVVDAIRRHSADTLDAECARWFERIDFATDRMTRMLDGLRQYAHESKESIECTEIKLEHLIDDVLSELHIAHVTENVRVTKRIRGLRVFADPDSLFRVIENLISNAVKHNSSAAQPSILVETSERNGVMRLSVSDNGPGIPPDRLSEVFLPFVRHGRQVEGSGLGLAIVQRHVACMGGRCWLESDGKLGTTAIVELPVAGAGAAAPFGKKVAA